MVRANLADWQAHGLVPDSRIEPGDKTDEPIRTRGWTHWHHLFTPRHLLIGALVRRADARPLAKVNLRIGLDLVLLPLS